MTVIRFGESDAARCRFGISPLWETLSAVRVLHNHRHRPLYSPWVSAKAGLAKGLDLDPVRAVQPRVGHTPDFLTPPPRTPRTEFAGELARVRATPPGRVAAELARTRDQPANPRAAEVDRMLADPAAARDRLADAVEAAWEALLEPDWPKIRRVLEDDIAHRGQRLTEGGFGALFDDLHPTLRWEGTQLVASKYRDHDRDLGGAGLLLVPGVFAWPYLVAVVAPAYQPAVLYPARGARLWTTAPPPPDRLARLLGRSRAAVLAALDPPSSTTELAGRYGLAPATVAEHLGALRDAGLADKRRHGHEVRYRRTELGQALVDAAVG